MSERVLAGGDAEKRGAERGVAVVTGAARRIGLAIAERLARSGYDIALHCSPRSADEAAAAAERLEAGSGIRTAILPADLADPAAPARILSEAGAALGPVTLLVNSAAIFEPDEAFAPELFDRHMAVNLRAPLLLGAAFMAQLPESREGAIVNIVDQRVLRPNPSFFSYSLSKAALWSATRTMAQAFSGRGVRVNAVGPGPTLPNQFDGEAGMRCEAAGVPLGRAVAPDEIAAAVLFLAEARSVTGQMIAVDSGQHLGWLTPDFAAASRREEKVR